MPKQFEDDFLTANNFHSVIHALAEAIRKIEQLEQRVKELEITIDTVSSVVVELHQFKPITENI